MFLLKKFLGEEYNRINSIVESYNNVSNNYINLEACCSYPFQSVLLAQSYPMFTLPTEGMVGERYFPSFKSMDDIDIYTEELLLQLLNLSPDDYGVCNQPHSGTQANQTVYNAILEDGDTILSLDPKSGGHISHNKFIKNINVVNFGLSDTYDIDYKEINRLAKAYNPKLIIIGASSFANNIDYECIGKIAHQVNAFFMVDACHTILYIMGKKFSNPFPYADFLTFSFEKVLRGPQGGIIVYRKKFKKKISYSIFPLTQGGPLQSVQFAKLLCLVELSKLDIEKYASKIQHINKLLNNVLTEKGIETYCTDNKTHIILIDVTKFHLTGVEAEKLFYENNILANKNQIPNDKLSPNTASGIRIGTTCLSNLNYSDEDIIILGKCIIQILTEKKVNKEDINYLIQKYHINVNISN